MFSTANDKLINIAKSWVKLGYSDAYIQGVIYAKAQYSIKEINEAINTVRKELKIPETI